MYSGHSSVPFACLARLLKAQKSNCFIIIVSYVDPRCSSLTHTPRGSEDEKASWMELLCRRLFQSVFSFLKDDGKSDCY
jgi:hypothetical protein